MKKVLLVVCAVVLLFSGSAFAAATPLKLSLWGNIAVPPTDAVYGVEVGIGNYTKELRGLSLNFIFGKTDDAIGIQTAIVTKTDKFTGLQWGFVNFNAGEVKGVQYGFFNRAASITGLQLGFVNIATEAPSFALQIGLVNYLGNSSLFKWFPIINAKI
ncbi:MAG: hypothetical protein FWC57_00745 [Endomicrobia bacterium]|nr:hypothetical protein [Endomicrobiia bacterium]